MGWQCARAEKEGVTRCRGTCKTGQNSGACPYFSATGTPAQRAPVQRARTTPLPCVSSPVPSFGTGEIKVRVAAPQRTRSNDTEPTPLLKMWQALEQCLAGVEQLLLQLAVPAVVALTQPGHVRSCLWAPQ